MEFGDRLSSLMKRHNVTDGMLAKYIGVSRQAVIGWKKGAIPKIDKIQKIAEYFEVPISYFGYSFFEELQQTKQSREVAIVGRIQAGYPIESYQGHYGTLYLPHDVRPNAKVFALEVVGDSMMPVVMEGDIIICQKGLKADGRICVVTVDGESTLKKVRLESNGKGITLIPTNPMYKEIHYSASEAIEKDLTIDGVLIQMVRNFE